MCELTERPLQVWGEKTMRRAWLSAGSLGLVLAVAASAKSGDDGPPPLTPPAEAPPPLEAPANVKLTQQGVTVVKKPQVGPRNGASLLRPRAAESPIRSNITATPPREVRAQPTDVEDLPPPLDAPPPLDGPSVETRRLPPDRSTRSSSGLERRRVVEPDPIILDPIDSTGRDLPPTLTAEEPDLNDKNKPKNAKPQTPSSRKRFSLFPGPSAPPRGRNNATERDSAIRVEPRADPAADAALKRKLEAKVKDAVGDRAKNVEVRVIDRNIVIRAKVDRFWNRRNVRRTIETLPALTGYKARVEIDD